MNVVQIGMHASGSGMFAARGKERRRREAGGDMRHEWNHIREWTDTAGRGVS